MEIEGANFLQRRVIQTEQPKSPHIQQDSEPQRSSKPEKLRQQKSETKRPRFNWLLILLIVMTVGLASGLGYLYIQYQKTQGEVKKLKDPTKRMEIQEQEAQRIVEALCKIMKCPPDEKPTVATIIDVEKLKKENLEFYKDAQNGDKFILYKTKAIIFRPEENLIINFAPVVYNPDQGNNQPNTNSTDKNN